MDDLNILPKKKIIKKPDDILNISMYLVGLQKTRSMPKSIRVRIDKEIDESVELRKIGNWLINAADWLDDPTTVNVGRKVAKKADQK